MFCTRVSLASIIEKIVVEMELNLQIRIREMAIRYLKSRIPEAVFCTKVSLASIIEKIVVEMELNLQIRIREIAIRYLKSRIPKVAYCNLHSTTCSVTCSIFTLLSKQEFWLHIDRM